MCCVTVCMSMGLIVWPRISNLERFRTLLSTRVIILHTRHTRHTIAKTTSLRDVHHPPLFARLQCTNSIILWRTYTNIKNERKQKKTRYGQTRDYSIHSVLSYTKAMKENCHSARFEFGMPLRCCCCISLLSSFSRFSFFFHSTEPTRKYWGKCRSNSQQQNG